MKKDINRRAALTGLLAIAAAAIPTAVSANALCTDTKLFALFTQWEEAKAQELSFGAEHAAMERRATAAEPPVPDNLLQPIEWMGEAMLPKGRCGWTVEELSLFRPANYRDMQAAKLDYDKQRDVIWAEAQAGQDRFDELVSATTDIVNEIGETPANTLQGLLAKCHIAQAEGLFRYFIDYSTFAQSIVDDIQRLAPQLSVGA